MINKAYLYRKNFNEKQVSIIGLNEDLGCFSCIGVYLGSLSLEKILSTQFNTLSFSKIGNRGSSLSCIGYGIYVHVKRTDSKNRVSCIGI